MVQAVKAKIIFLDLDGTLLDDDKRISDSNLAVLKNCQRRGLLCGIVTSRRRRKLFDLFQGFSPDFIAYYDGAIAEVKKENGFERLYHLGISHDVCFELCNDFKHLAINQKCAGIAVDIINDDGSVVSLTPNEYIEKYKIRKADALRVRLYGLDSCLAECLIHSIQGVQITIEKNDLIIGSSQYNKGYATSRILNYYSVDPESAICFGNSESDVSMFDKCGIAVAMQNADDAVKDAADFITLSNRCDGVADFINKYMLDSKIGHDEEPEKYHMIVSSFPKEEGIFLLKNLTGQIKLLDFKEKIEYLESGGKSYNIICRENNRTKEELEYIRKLINTQAPLVAQKTAIMSEKIFVHKKRRPVLVSLARGGIPYGVLCRRYLKKYHQYEAPHYVVSLVRGVGLDENAIQFILRRHEDKDIIFIDGWTGSGYLNGQLKQYVNILNHKYGTHIVPDVAVVADLAEVCSISGTTEDIFLPSACLNAEVSGLISNICINEKYTGTKDFHGCVFMNDMKTSDLSMYYVNAISAAFQRVESSCIKTLRKGSGNTCSIYNSSRIKLLEQLELSNDTIIRLGIGESFRALFRQPLACIVVNNENDPDVKYLLESAVEKNIEVIHADLGKYKGAAVLL